MATVQWDAVEDRAMVKHVHAGVQAGARGPARCRLGIMLFESNTISNESIEVRRLDMGVAQGRQAITSPLIRSYEKYVH
jgi:hypothetical protein